MVMVRKKKDVSGWGYSMYKGKDTWRCMENLGNWGWLVWVNSSMHVSMSNWGMLGKLKVTLGNGESLLGKYNIAKGIKVKYIWKCKMDQLWVFWVPGLGAWI